jgi:hypothetical protein
MSIMLEVLYRAPRDAEKETRIARILEEFNGHLTHKEEPADDGLSDTVCLTFEFAERHSALAAANRLRMHGEHVEGPMDYGDD